MRTIDLIAGARPNFMKIAPIMDALKVAEAHGGTLRYRLIHNGQHYYKAMSSSFFEQLGIPEPDINPEVGSGTQAEQTAAIMVRYEKVLLERRSDQCLVVGDVTSTMACSIATLWRGPDFDGADPRRSAGIRGWAASPGLAAVLSETSMAAQVFVLGISGARVVHVDRSEEVKRARLIAAPPAPTFVQALSLVLVGHTGAHL